MSIIRWKENRLISIKLRNGKFILAQLLQAPYMIFFNLYNNSAIWSDINIEEKNIIFCHAVTRQFIKSSECSVITNISPLVNYTPPTEWIHAVHSTTKVLHINNTSDRTVVLIAKDPMLVRKYILNSEKNTDPSGIYEKVLQYDLKPKDFDKITSIELTTIEMYPYLNERLLLCHKFNKNVDPYKEIIFDQTLPDEYLDFVNILTNEVDPKKLGY